MTQKVILCYGDSNTWGYVPSANQSNFCLKRYSRDERWPGTLQHLLGEDYYVIEEGLNGRTTNLDYHIPPDRNGKTYLPSCLYSHAPIDLVILALGGNDFKTYFNRSAEDIRDGLIELIDIIQKSQYGKGMQEPPKVLIINPPIPLTIAEQVVDENGIGYFKDAICKSNCLIKLYGDISEEKNCDYLDISSNIITSDIDGVHLDKEMHRKLAEMIYKKIKNIFDC